MSEPSQIYIFKWLNNVFTGPSVQTGQKSSNELTMKFTLRPGDHLGPEQIFMTSKLVFGEITKEN